MKPPVVDIEMTRGDTFPLLGAITNAGVVVDLTDGKIWMTASSKAGSAIDDADALFQLTSDGPEVVFVSAIGGTYRITIPPSATRGLLGLTKIPYDVQFVDASGDVHTVVRGLLTIVPDVTIETT